MHELAICQALIGEVVEVANAERATAVSDIYVSVGPLSGAEPPLMHNAFPIAAAGTVADRAMLHLEEAPVRVRCTACDRDSEAAVNRLVCAHCGDWRTTLVSGDELLLRRVVFERETAGVPAHV